MNKTQEILDLIERYKLRDYKHEEFCDFDYHEYTHFECKCSCQYCLDVADTVIREIEVLLKDNK